MTLTFHNSRFVAISNYEERFIPKHAGFRWDPKDKRWWTDSPDKAVKLREYANESCLREFARVEDEREKLFAMSSAEVCDLEIPVPEGLRYREYQKAGIAFALQCCGNGRQGALIADSPGVGKTIQAIGLINITTDIRKVLVLCPATIKINWLREAEKWLTRKLTVAVGDSQIFPYHADIVILNYDIVKKLHAKLTATEWDLMILDESHYCFPYNTLVMTNIGPIEIGDIVEHELDVFVLTCNLSSSALSYQPITSRFKSRFDGNLIRVVHSGGSFVCTENHKIWTTNGYREAVKITRGTKLRILRTAIFNSNERKGYSKILHKALRVFVSYGRRNKAPKNSRGTFKAFYKKSMWLLRKSIRVSISGQRDQRQKTFLWQQLCCEMANKATAYPKQNIYAITTGKDKQGFDCYTSKESQFGTSIFKKNEKQKSHAEPRNEKKGFSKTQGSSFSSKTRRQWQTVAKTTKNACRKIKLGNRICCIDKACADKSAAAQSLQNRYCEPETYDSYRGRWYFSQGSKNTKSRPQKGTGLAEVRVESIEVYKRGNYRQFGKSSNGDHFVYNLEIEQNHNYFADGILVSNCKNRNALRTKYIFGQKKWKDREEIKPIPTKRTLALSGTPILNKPEEVWTVIHHLDPKTWSNWWQFAQEYCGATEVRYGRKRFWDTSGASNLQALNAKLRSSVMIRRTKAEVLKELPPKTRQIIELQATTPEMQEAIGNEMTIWQMQQKNIDFLKQSVKDAEDNEVKYREAVKRLNEGKRTAFTELAKVRHQTAIAKVPHIFAHLTEAIESGSKMVFWAHHRDVLERVFQNFPQAVLLYGGMNDKQKQAAIDAFQKDDSVRLFVGGIQAAGIGITLTASSHAVFGELEWTPAKVTQCEDRSYRLGTESAVLVQQLVLENSIDAHIAKIMIEKQEIIDAAVDGKHINMEEAISPF